MDTWAEGTSAWWFQSAGIQPVNPVYRTPALRCLCEQMPWHPRVSKQPWVCASAEQMGLPAHRARRPQWSRLVAWFPSCIIQSLQTSQGLMGAFLWTGLSGEDGRPHVRGCCARTAGEWDESNRKNASSVLLVASNCMLSFKPLNALSRCDLVFAHTFHCTLCQWWWYVCHQLHHANSITVTLSDFLMWQPKGEWRKSII